MITALFAKAIQHAPSARMDTISLLKVFSVKLATPRYSTATDVPTPTVQAMTR